MVSLKSEFAGQAGRLETQVGFLNVHNLKWNSFLSSKFAFVSWPSTNPRRPTQITAAPLIVDVNHICKTFSQQHLPECLTKELGTIT